MILADVARLAHRARRLGARRRADPRADPVRRRRQDPGRDQGGAGRAAADRLQGGRRRAGHPRGHEGAGRRATRPPTSRPRNPAALAAAVDRLQAAAAAGAVGRGRGRLAPIARSTRCPPPAGRPSPAIRCCGSTRDAIPPETEAAIKTHQQGARSTCSARPTSVLRRGARRSSASSARSSGSPAPTRSPPRSRSRATPTARFGWNVVDPGHGLVFANARRPQDAAAAAPLSATGTYGPLLLLTDAGVLPAAAAGLPARHPARLRRTDPVRGVYNHGWIIGDESAIAAARAGAHRYAPGDPARRHRSASEMAEAEQPERLRGAARSRWTTCASSMAQLDAALRAAAPQPHPEADRGPAGRRSRRGSRRGARSRGWSGSASPARSAATPEQPGMRALPA